MTKIMENRIIKRRWNLIWRRKHPRKMKLLLS
jgi:hypothetical protein